MGCRIVLLAQCITDVCVERRSNPEYVSAAGRKKSLNLARQLASAGHRVTIVSSSYSKRSSAAFVEPIADNISVRHLPTLGLFGRHSVFKRTIAALCNAWTLLRHRHAVDLVVIYNYHVEFALPALLAKRLLGVPFVLDYEDGLFVDPSYQGPGYRAIERAVYRACSGIIFVNPNLARRVARFAVQPPGITVNGYFNVERVSGISPSPGDRNELLFSGNFSVGFGFDELVACIINLPPGYTLAICGRAGRAETEKIEALCREHPRARMLGFVSEEALADLMRRARAVLLLNDPGSRFNDTNFPSKLFDYLSRGKIVISTQNPLLAPYRSLRCLLFIDGIAADFPRLDALLQTRRFSAAEISPIDERIQRELDELVNLAARPGRKPPGATIVSRRPSESSEHHE